MSDRFGFFATVPLPDAEEATQEAVRALDHLNADGLIMLANAAGSYLGTGAHDELFAELDARSAVVLVHPATLPGPRVPGIPPFAADFLLDTTRAAYLLVRNSVLTRYPRIRFILSHAGGFVPYAAHRLAASLAADTGVPTLEFLEQFRSFFFDTALSSSPSALPALLVFARPERILFGSDWPFAPATAVRYFATGLDTHPIPADTRDAIHAGNAARLFPRLGVTPASIAPPSARDRIARRVQRAAARAVFRLVQRTDRRGEPAASWPESARLILAADQQTKQARSGGLPAAARLRAGAAPGGTGSWKHHRGRPEAIQRRARHAASSRPLATGPRQP